MKPVHLLLIVISLLGCHKVIDVYEAERNFLEQELPGTYTVIHLLYPENDSIIGTFTLHKDGRVTSNVAPTEQGNGRWLVESIKGPHGNITYHVAMTLTEGVYPFGYEASFLMDNNNSFYPVYRAEQIAPIAGETYIFKKQK